MEVGPSTRTGTRTDLIHSLLTFPICLFPLPSYLVLAYSPLSPSFDLSSSVSMGAASQQSLEVREKTEAKPGVLWEHGGPWGWTERWRTDTGVCDKRMCFTANDSHRGDQMLRLQRLTHVLLPCRIHESVIKLEIKTNVAILGQKSHRYLKILLIFLVFNFHSSPFLSFCSNHSNVLQLLQSHCPQFALVSWEVTKTLCMNSDVTVQLLSRLLSVAKKGCFGTVRHNQ